jgi:hypothetical protein
MRRNSREVGARTVQTSVRIAGLERTFEDADEVRLGDVGREVRLHDPLRVAPETRRADLTVDEPERTRQGLAHDLQHLDPTAPFVQAVVRDHRPPGTAGQGCHRLVDGGDLPAIEALRERAEHRLRVFGGILDQKHAGLHGRRTHEDAVRESSTRIGGDAAVHREPEESRKTKEAAEIHTRHAIPAEIPEPGRAEYHRKPKRGLSDDPGGSATGGILLGTTGYATESQT